MKPRVKFQINGTMKHFDETPVEDIILHLRARMKVQGWDNYELNINGISVMAPAKEFDEETK